MIQFGLVASSAARISRWIVDLRAAINSQYDSNNNPELFHKRIRRRNRSLALAGFAATPLIWLVVLIIKWHYPSGLTWLYVLFAPAPWWALMGFGEILNEMCFWLLEWMRE